MRFSTLIIAAALVAPSFSAASAASPFHGAYRHRPAFSGRTATQAASDVRHLLQMMDADKNGVISKEEFMNFMSQTYDRLDVNRNEQLEPSEIMRGMCRGGRGPLFCDKYPQ